LFFSILFYNFASSFGAFPLPIYIIGGKGRGSLEKDNKTKILNISKRKRNYEK